MEKVKVDILLPYWGEFNLLKQTVDSIIAQTSNNWRLTIFDDCYPSDEAYLYYTALNDERINYIRHKKNIGITNNFNFALDRASADYCVIIGCDDIMLPNYIETALKNIGSADFYQPAVEIIDKNGHIYTPLTDRIKRLLQPRKSGLYEGEKLASSICTGNWLYFPSIMWKTQVAKKYRFDSAYKIAEDLILELTIIKNGGRLFFDQNITFQYRRFADSLSSKEKSKNGVRFDEEALVYKRFAKEFAAIGWRKASRAANLRITSHIHELMNRL